MRINEYYSASTLWKEKKKKARVFVNLRRLHEDGCSTGLFWLQCGNWLTQEILTKIKRRHILRTFTTAKKEKHTFARVFMLME